MRPSKYRHVFGQAAKREHCYENLKPTLSAYDSNIIQANGKYLALNSNGIGAFTVIPIDEIGKAPEKVPMFRGHTGGYVNDTAFDPFDDDKIVSAGEDGKICLWEVPKNYTYAHADKDNIVDVSPLGTLSGHTRKVGHLSFNPVAKDILASSSFDYSVKIWNLETMQCITTLQQKDLITSFTWNYNGTQIATASRDKKLRIWDARSGILLAEAAGHTGAKSTRIVWLGNTNRIATTGFDRFSERQIGLWDTLNLDKGPIGGVIPVDSSSGILMPFFDPSTNLLFLAGKGDGNVRYYEYSVENDDIYELSEFQSTDAQRGFAVAPKRFVNVKDNEILKCYKLLNNATIQPLSFIVPRRAEMFQDDIFPDAPANVAALSADEFISGKVVLGPMLCSMRDIYEGIDSPSISKSTTTPSTAATQEFIVEKKPEPKPEPVAPVLIEEPTPVFTQTPERGVESMLKEKKVNSLLSKVNDLSDDEYQGVDAANDDEDGEWKVEKKNTAEPKVESKVEPTPVPIVKSEPKIDPLPKTDSVPVVSESKPTASSGGLKANMERLHELVNSLELTVEKLTKSNFEKDERLKTLEEKLDLILNKL